jgi:predicted nucleotidyltransferase
MPEYFSSIKGMHHYLAMAKKNFDSHLNGNQIKIKKLFYILRPLLACEWIAEKQAMPPTEYGILLEQSIRLSGNQLKEVQAFMKLKESAEEGFLISLTEDLIDWFKKEIIFYQKVAAEMPKANEVSMEPLNELFRMALKL